MKQTPYINGRPRSTHFRATQLAARKYTVNPRTGKVYNSDGVEIGGNTYEPRVTVHLGDGRKYNVRTNKLVAYVVEGPEALRRGVSVRHKDGNKNNNRANNLQLVYSQEAAKALRRRIREAQYA
jgi:HNH endonuclease